MTHFRIVSIFFSIQAIAYLANIIFKDAFLYLLTTFLPFEYNGQNQSNLVIFLAATVTYFILLIPVCRNSALVNSAKMKKLHPGMIVVSVFLIVGVWLGALMYALDPTGWVRYEIIFFVFNAFAFLCIQLLSAVIFHKLKELI